MLAAAAAARKQAAGHEAVCVSHQLPIWIMRLRVEDRRLWHDPRRRQCSLASITTIRYEGEKIRSISYTEPAADLVPSKIGPAGA
jgi:broad specificity phosphatase PhoE